MIRAAALAVAACVSTAVAHAAETDRLAIERRPGEAPWDAAAAYLEGCLVLGVEPRAIEPVGSIALSGTSFERLHVIGSTGSLRCLEALPSERGGLDGTVQWLDGQGGALRIGADDDEPDRLPESIFEPPAERVPSAAVEPGFLEALARADSEALSSVAQSDVATALALTYRLASIQGGSRVVALERIARLHSHWLVRRTALGLLAADLSLETLVEAAREDDAWQVRQGALSAIGRQWLALSRQGASTDHLMRALIERASEDSNWIVRREALWVLGASTDSKATAAVRAASRDADPRVRATSLELLAESGQLSRADARSALADDATSVRVIGALVLARNVDAADVTLLWQAMRDPDRAVRLAASELLDFIHDDTIAGDLWKLFVEEAARVDADGAYLERLAGALSRAPFPLLPTLVEQRLPEATPGERRALARLLATVAPERARTLLASDLDSPDGWRRAIAAEVLPNDGTVLERKRELLADEDDDVRAAAVLGLCRTPGPVHAEELASVALASTSLGREAAVALARCGVRAEDRPRLRTALNAPTNDKPTSDRSVDPLVVVALALLIVSVLAERIRRSPQ